MTWLALDIGGANIKASDGLDWSISKPFDLWKHPGSLPFAVAAVLLEAPRADRLAVTMTGELADCFLTKAEGVSTILDAVVLAADRREVFIYQTNGVLVPPDEARGRPLLAAASNWHALARYAGRFAESDTALLLDVGSTTTDVVPLRRGEVDAQGRTDPERLASGELIYTGVVRSPLCALVQALPWQGRACGVAQELFATTLDAYLLLGDLPEDLDSNRTADGRPATKDHAWDRMARMICADRSLMTQAEAVAAARVVAQQQLVLLSHHLRQVGGRGATPPQTIILSGQGEFLGRRAVERVFPRSKIVSLSEALGPAASRSAPAYALACIAREFTVPRG